MLSGARRPSIITSSAIPLAARYVARPGKHFEARFNSSSAGYQVPKPPSGLPLSKIIRNTVIFPLSVKESFKHYTQRKDLDRIQDELLSTLPFYPTPNETHSAEVIHTVVNSSTGEYINELHIKPKVSSDKHVLFVHGYGAGLGFFIKNLEEIAKERPDWHIHAIDLPGYGCSTRGDFPWSLNYSEYEKIEDWFTERLSSWWMQRKLNKDNTVVVAHSMGAYLCSVLNFVRPDLFQRMLLVSPAGIYHSRTQEILDATPGWFKKLWGRNISPFVLVRNTGPLGSMFVSGWTSRRFSKNPSLLNKHEQKLLHMYTYAIFNARGSGEYMLNYFLGPGGVPKHPLLDRLNRLRCDTTWLYGSHDWMDKLGGIQACNMLRRKSLQAEMVVVPDAGHHIYIDNFDVFNRLTLREMDRL